CVWPTRRSSTGTRSLIPADGGEPWPNGWTRRSYCGSSSSAPPGSSPRRSSTRCFSWFRFRVMASTDAPARSARVPVPRSVRGAARRCWRAALVSPSLQPRSPATVVVTGYSRSALAIPEHLVDMELASDTQYLWSVRARFELDGQPRVTPCGVLILPGQSPGDDPRSVSVPPRGYYRFVTP